MDVAMNVAMIDTILGYRLLSSVIVFGALILIVLLFCSFMAPRKSKMYRRVIADLYVAGKIKKFAEEDKINLVEEEINFNRWLKKERLRDFSLDNVVEIDLNERITESRTKTPPEK